MLESAHLEKVLSSSTFRSSESLQKLLSYLADHSLGDSPHPVKEYQIATEVLGRGPQFDPRMDSSVRVNVARLRSKLLEYYATEGKEDPLRIAIPKGSYVIVLRDHAPAPPATPPDEDPVRAGTLDSKTEQQAASKAPRLALAATLVIGLALGALAAFWLTPTTASHGSNSDAVLQGFWGDFNRPDQSTIVVFSNARFVGDTQTGLRYFDPEIHRLEDIRDLHTGVGEVIGVYELSRLFQSLGTAMEVKRAALADWDQLKKANVIFIGGPAENMPVRELLREARFVFDVQPASDGQPRVVVVNRGAGNGEPQLFDPGAANPVRRDYAVIRLHPGLIPDRRIMILAGISTLGTQAAVEFVCRPDTVQLLLSKLAEHSSDEARGFEAVLKVHINGGVPVDSKLVAFHAISANDAVLSSAE